MPKTDGSFDPTRYATVAERISLFYESHPSGRIETDLVTRDVASVTFKARVYRSEGDTVPAATGWATEREVMATSTPSRVSRTQKRQRSGARSRTSGSQRPNRGRAWRRCARRSACAGRCARRRVRLRVRLHLRPRAWSLKHHRITGLTTRTPLPTCSHLLARLSVRDWVRIVCSAYATSWRAVRRCCRRD